MLNLQIEIQRPNGTLRSQGLGREEEIQTVPGAHVGYPTEEQVQAGVPPKEGQRIGKPSGNGDSLREDWFFVCLLFLRQSIFSHNPLESPIFSECTFLG